jgi:hypothetical protein
MRGRSSRNGRILQRYRVPYEICGKVVASSQQQESELRELYNRCVANGFRSYHGREPEKVLIEGHELYAQPNARWWKSFECGAAAHGALT